MAWPITSQGAVVVEVRDIRAEHASPVRLAQDQEVVQTRPPHAAHEAPACHLGARRADGRVEDPNLARGGEAVASLPVLAIVVVDQEPWDLPEWRGLAQQLRHPSICGVPCDATMHHPARAKRDDKERTERTEAQVDDRGEVAGPDRLGVVVGEGRPRVARRPTRARRPQIPQPQTEALTDRSTRIPDGRKIVR